MLDPLLTDLMDQDVPTTSEVQTKCMLGSHIAAFNPYLSLNSPGLPDSFYATLSIYNQFSLVSCQKYIHDEEMVAVTMDKSVGFVMATQARYPDTIFYSLSRDDWDVERSSINLLLVDELSSDLEGLVIQAKEYNALGVDLCFCSEPSEYKVGLVCDVVRVGGMAIVEVESEPNSDWLLLLLSNFSRVVAYKPATVSPVAAHFYLVCTGREQQLEVTLRARARQLGDQLTFLEEHRQRCVHQIVAGVQNSNRVDVHQAKLNYLSV